jgi:hypothetical protein
MKPIVTGWEYDENKREEKRNARDRFMKQSFRAYQQIEYTHPQSGKSDICLLCGVDFDEEILYLMLPDSSDYKTQWDSGIFPANIRNCKVIKSVLKKH